MRPAMKPTPDRHGACRGQRGIAALEFSLTLTMLLMFICAVVGYGVLFWMQQQLAAAANEGARAAVFARFSARRREWRGLHGGDGRVLDRLRGGLRHHPRACAWSGAGGQTANCATISMTYNTQSWPVLATMQALIAMLPGTNRTGSRQIVFQSHRANLTRDTMSSLSKIIAGVLLAAGLVLAFVAWRLASAPSSPPQPVTPVAASAPAPQEPVKFYPVVVAAKAIPAGTRIAPDMLEVAKWQVALSGGFPAADLLAGAIVRTDVAVGDPLLPSMLAHGMASLLQPGERALAVAVDEVSGGGNRILPGDFVDVFFMLDKSSEVQAGQARLLQSQLRVLAYGANSLDGPEEKSLLQQGAPAQPAKTAVLAVPVERVSELMLASRAGRLQLALRPLGDAGVPDIALFPQRRAACRRAPT